jgi:hypothetical protein
MLEYQLNIVFYTIVSNLMNTELYTTYNNTPILDEYENQNIKKIDEVLASIPQPDLTKFNFAPTPSSKKFKIQKLFIGLGTSLLIFCLCLGFFMMPLISGATEILPINPNPSNEKLTVTSKRSSFFVQYDNKTYYSLNQNGVWTLDLGKISGNNKLKVGTYIDFGLFKINSSKTEEFGFNRNYEVSNVTTDVNKYYNISKGEFNININSPEKYFKITNADKIIYETGANKNDCRSKIENTKTMFTCAYEFGMDKKDLNFDLKIQDEFGNIKQLEPIVAQLVPVNDFSCNTKSIYANAKISCIGNKNGQIVVNNTQIVQYQANKKIDLPVPIQEGDNKVSLKMVDEHGFENSINLEFLFDKTPLNVAIKSDEDSVNVTSNKDNTSIEVKVVVNYANILTGKIRMKDFSDRLKLNTTIVNKGVETNIISNEISITKEEFNTIRNLETIKDGTATFVFEDSRGKTDSKTCDVNPKELNKKYYLKLKC